MSLRLQVIRKPHVITLFLAASWVFLSGMWYLSHSVFLLVIALLYGLAFAFGLYALCAIRKKEVSLTFDRPERLLIVAPHQDDCVICAGGLGIANIRQGGETHVAYLYRDRRADVAEVRQQEAVHAWALAGGCNLYHLNVLPALGERSPVRIRETADRLQELIDRIRPSVLCMPLFEGGHVHHDITNYVISYLVRRPSGLRIYECPEYSPYFSFTNTPHKVLGLLSRCLLFFVSYFGPSEGIDPRPIFELRMSGADIDLKRRMLRAFESQGGRHLAGRFGWPDRLIEWVEKPYQATPFNYRGSLAHTLHRLRKTSLQSIVKRLFPWEYKSVGLAEGITNIDYETSAETAGIGIDS